MTDLKKDTECELRPTGRLVAIKIPAAPPVIDINVHDSIGLPIKEQAILHGTGEQTEAVRVSDSEGISSTVDATEAGISQAVWINTGRTPQNEQGGQEVCRTLIERLNLDGRTINPATLRQVKDPNDDTDFIATDGIEELRFQVTRAEPARKFWHLLSKFLKQEHEWADAGSCADGIRDAIAHKAGKISTVSQRDKIILAIDAVHSPALALTETITMFRRMHGAWASNLRFRSIWAVGPASSLTHCISDSP